jgi:hypothetical protein
MVTAVIETRRETKSTRKKISRIASPRKAVPVELPII